MTRKMLAIAIFILTLFSCKKHDFEKYEFDHSMDLSNQTHGIYEMWNVMADEAVNRKLADIENENSFEGYNIEYLELFCIQDETENKILDDLNIAFLDGHSYYLITFEIGDIYDFDSSFDEEHDVNPVYTKTVVLKNNCYGYLKWWKVKDNGFKSFEYSVSDANGNRKKTQLKR